MKINITTFEQPIGTFALGTMKAKDIIKIMTTQATEYDQETFKSSNKVQREISPKRTTDIAIYAKDDPNACFPTSIILALPENNSDEIFWELIDNNTLFINDDKNNFALVVDGQHRLGGLEKAGEDTYNKFEIPVVFLFEPTLEQQALIFSIINEKQTKVSFSLVSQLFGVLNTRCIEKVSHSFASAFNSRSESPFYKRVKMLGKKSPNIDNQSISQGTMVREFLKLFSPGKVLREFYDEKTEDFALKVLFNYFNAAKNIWSYEWDRPEKFILTKTVGFSGLIKAFPYIFDLIDNSDKKFTTEKFENIFDATKKRLEKEELELTSDFFPSNNSGASSLSKIIIDECETLYK